MEEMADGTPGPERGDTGNRSEPAGHPDRDYRDRLPDDLDASGYVGPYSFPNNNRRRIAGVIYALAGLACLAGYALRGDGELVNRGFLVGGILLLVLACYHMVSGVTLRIDETEALVAATRTVGFPVGHASAQLSWRGLLSRPTWRILLYSADDPPTRRGLVLIDGVNGRVGDHIVEDNPEDWSSFDR
jgi:hypothetical protein